MSFKKCFALALNSLMTSKMRSFLTMLGIIIGVGAVIILVSLMNGMTGQVTGIFADLGTTGITVSVQDRGGSRKVTADDMYRLMEENPSLISGVSPNVTVPNATVKHQGNDITSSLSGVSEDYGKIRNVKLAQGRFLQYIDVAKKQKVCVIGAYQQKEFFDGAFALGETIKCSGEAYKVIGVIEEKADATAGSEDDVIYIPYPNAARMMGTDTISSFLIGAVTEEKVDAAVEVINKLLDDKIGDSDYYNAISMKQMLDSMNTILGTMETVLVCIAGISLLVGGIGIMNIMLVSVTERTREIGIRKSLGAKQKDIMRQFVIEAGTVSGIGGIIGIIFGAVVSMAAGSLLDLTVVPSAGAVAVAFGVSVGIGILFGFLPASKAAKLNPIEALRYD